MRAIALCEVPSRSASCVCVRPLFWRAPRMSEPISASGVVDSSRVVMVRIVSFLRDTGFPWV